MRHTVTLEQTARIIGTTVKVIRGAIRSGELEAIQLGRRLYILREPLERKLKLEPGGILPFVEDEDDT